MQLLTTSLLLLLNAGPSLQFERPAAIGVRSLTEFNPLYGSKIFSRQDCDGQICADVCIPSDAMCCDVTVGIYCEAGQTCTTTDTCIDEGSSSGSSGSGITCDDDQKICGGGCISSSNNCCSSITGDYCLSGMECLSSSTCDDTTGNGSGNGSSSSDSGDDESSDDSSSSSSGSGKSSSSSGGSGSGNSTSTDSRGSTIAISTTAVVAISFVFALIQAN